MRRCTAKSSSSIAFCEVAPVHQRIASASCGGLADKVGVECTRYNTCTWKHFHVSNGNPTVIPWHINTSMVQCTRCLCTVVGTPPLHRPPYSYQCKSVRREVNHTGRRTRVLLNKCKLDYPHSERPRQPGQVVREVEGRHSTKNTALSFSLLYTQLSRRTGVATIYLGKITRHTHRQSE
jgi:hypothetical protein